MEDSDFAFNYCPDCGGSIKQGGIFSGMGAVMAGRNGRCCDCGREWHVIFENADDWQPAEVNED